MKKSIEKKILKLNNLRDIELLTYNNSWDDEEKEYSKQWPKIIDTLGDEILSQLIENKDALPFEFIIEQLTKLGQAPCLLYDDNGFFAISGEGFSSVSFGNEPVDMKLTNFVEAKQWKPTIREALNTYLMDMNNFNT